MPGIDMLVKFGYCVICDNGPEKQKHHWIAELLQSEDVITNIVTHCNSCGGGPTGVEAPNNNLLRLEVKITGLN
jgi:hypothetical protein